MVSPGSRMGSVPCSASRRTASWSPLVLLTGAAGARERDAAGAARARADGDRRRARRRDRGSRARALMSCYSPSGSSRGPYGSLDGSRGSGSGAPGSGLGLPGVRLRITTGSSYFCSALRRSSSSQWRSTAAGSAVIGALSSGKASRYPPWPSPGSPGLSRATVAPRSPVRRRLATRFPAAVAVPLWPIPPPLRRLGAACFLILSSQLVVLLLVSLSAPFSSPLPLPGASWRRRLLWTLLLLLLFVGLALFSFSAALFQLLRDAPLGQFFFVPHDGRVDLFLAGHVLLASWG
jgi:hypothetical protein